MTNFTQDYVDVLQYINSNELELVNSKSPIPVALVHELVTNGMVDAVDVGMSEEPLTYLNPTLTMQGKSFLMNNA